ncbi:hypothetical protein NAPIS_ORF00172 [Vairimorpha apis BRL 01]|uniref:Uncharacterized protein n=1 Tax=Vairimorpha apis BRL 01 TaxID=1037528 RepID=T0MGI9_9MICR|nr:hypothetical protein NAPIS_ORF00172 [Vairimorpha apis BRL 01]
MYKFLWFFSNCLNSTINDISFKSNNKNIEQINSYKIEEIGNKTFYDIDGGNSININFNYKSLNDNKYLYMDKNEEIILKRTLIGDNFKNIYKCKENCLNKELDLESSLRNYLNNIDKNVDNELYYCIYLSNDINKIIELCSILINENINEIKNSDEFVFLFNLLEHDLINILNGLNYLNEENEEISKLVFYLDQWQPYEYKIPLFIKVVQDLKYMNYKINFYLDFKTCQKLNRWLKTRYLRSKSYKIIESKVNCKLNYLKNIKNENITLDEIFKYMFFNISKITDMNIKFFFIFGLQNLFFF